MTQTTGRFFDDLARLMTDAAGAAQGVRTEVDSIIRAQAERILNDLDMVNREEFEAVREMAANARAENERLEARIAALEARLDAATTKAKTPAKRQTGTTTARRPGAAKARKPSK